MNKNTVKKILKEGLMLPYASTKNQIYNFLDKNVVEIFETIFDDTFLICTDEEKQLGFFVEIKKPEQLSDGWETSEHINQDMLLKVIILGQ